MIIKEILEKLENDNTFTEWKNQNTKSFLAHIFRVYEKEDNNTWQIGFYSSDDDTITPIEIKDEKISVGEKSEVFKEENSKINELDIEKVTIDIKEAVEECKKVQIEKYPKEMPTKIIVILQIVNNIPTYNCTYVTQTFKTLNIKINATNKEIISDNLTTIFDFK